MAVSLLKKIKANIIIFAVLLVVIMLLRQYSMFESLENLWLDNLFSMRYFLMDHGHSKRLSRNAATPIVIVTMPSHQEMRKKYEKSGALSSQLAGALEILSNYNARVIAFNFFPSFTKPDQRNIQAVFAKKKSDPLILPLIFIRMGKKLSLIGGPDSKAKSIAGGLGILEVSSNVKMRWLPMFENINKSEYRHYLVEILTKFYGLTHDEVSIKKTLLGTEIRFGENKKLALFGRNRFYVDYFAASSRGSTQKPQGFCTFFKLDQITSQEFSPEDIEGKIVMVGSIDPVERYYHMTPLGFISDSEIYAQALYSILQGPRLVILPNLALDICLVLLGFGCLTLFTRVNIRGNPLKGNTWVLLILIVLILALSTVLFFTRSIYIDVIPFILLFIGAFFLSIYTSSEEQQEELDRNLEKFKSIVASALAGSESVDWGSSMLTLICNPLKVDRGVLILIRDDKFGPDAREIYCYPVVEDARPSLHEEEVEAMLKVKKPALAPSSLVVPLIKGNDRFGAIKLQKRSFTSKELQIMMALSHMTFISLYNIRLMEKIRKSERLQMEAELAGQIQKAFLVDKAPDLRGVTIACRCMPASEAGGDYFDFITYQGQEGVIGIAVADVTGHGMGAAIITGLLRSGLRAQSALSSSPAEVVTSINNVLYNDFVSFGKMASLHYATYSVVDKTLTFTNAGQSPPMLIRREEPQARILKGKGPILGFRQNIKYKEFRNKIYPGDIIVFMTDGIVEAENEQKEFFGTERIEKIVRDHMDKTAQEILDRVFEAVGDFTSGLAQKDDNTLIVMKV